MLVHKVSNKIILALLLMLFIGQTTTVFAVSSNILSQDLSMSAQLDCNHHSSQVAEKCKQTEDCSMPGCIPFAISTLNLNLKIKVTSQNIAIIPINLELKKSLSSLYRPPILS